MSISIAPNKQRLNTHLTEEAYGVLAKYTKPKAIGTFLSNLLIEYDRSHTVVERIQRAEQELMEIKTQVFMQEVARRVDAAKADLENETVPFELVMKEMGIDVDYPPQA